ncbi:ABC transporter substrate-binding protein [Vineibacter terrae]|uniref:ABC transporter substrate-binding protein n=1 Tax=Vineibacter terrae TaxID=2586908 RepID=UPI002E34301F|nr:ABC transporter substrate-binding protein [Vineibacter terrae]HEX2885200.1 ABC transporter substrate-binding protein [Vineibacter terrae]
MSTTRRKALIASATFAAGLAAPTLLKAQGPAPEVKSIALGFGIDPPFAPHILAIRKGWFAEAGFTDVKTQSFASGNLAGEALMAGQIQIWTPGNLPPIAMAANGVPVVVLGTNCVNWNLEKLVVRNDANVSKPEDLYGIKIALIQGSTSSAFIATLAKHYALDERRLQIVNLPPPEQLAAFTAKDVQALLCWEPWPYRALAAVPSQVVHSGLISGFAANKGATVKVSNNRSIWVTSQDFARRNPKATRAVLAVLLRAQKYVANKKNQDEVIQVFSEHLKQDPSMNKAIWDNFVFDPSFDEAYLDDMSRTADYLLAAGRIRSKVDPLSFSHTSLMKELDPAAVKIAGGWKA